MTKYLWAYAGSAAVFLLGDLIWLGFVAIGYYREQLGDLLLEKPVISVAFLFYALYLVGLVVFAVTPGLREGSWKIALLMGGLFGLFAYGTYDLTNLATLRNWSVGVTLLDMAWGIVVSGLASTAGYVLSVYMEP
ncbi:MAG: DUF2177 family protein [Alphaproteobacteria bacterium]|nr:DUF2177 family protein [Alphaproteobacteria bacterium]